MNNERNPVGWFEIYVQDMPRARAFYEHVLQVKLTELPSPAVKMLAFPSQSDRPGCGGALVSYEGKGSGAGGTLVYFSCHDCAVEAARTVEFGGRVFKPKFPIGQYGFISLVFDTEGNMVGLHSMK